MPKIPITPQRSRAKPTQFRVQEEEEEENKELLLWSQLCKRPIDSTIAAKKERAASSILDCEKVLDSGDPNVAEAAGVPSRLFAWETTCGCSWTESKLPMIQQTPGKSLDATSRL
jgi:hypothetical protein